MSKREYSSKARTAATRTKPVKPPETLQDAPKAKTALDTAPVEKTPPNAAPEFSDDLRQRLEASIASAVKNAPPAIVPKAEGRTIKSSGEFPPTEEQEVVIEAALEGPPVLVVVAGAGAGKTTTLRFLADNLEGNGQYTAFNSKLVDDSKSKFFGTRVACNTTHSLAFRAVGKQYAHRLNGRRMRSYEVAAILGINDLDLSKDKTLTPAHLATLVTKALGRFSQQADKEITTKHFPYIDGIDMPVDGKRTYEANEYVRQYLLPFVQAAWDDVQSRNGVLPFSHDYYVKLWQLGNPVIAADYILLDEAQDSAPVLLDIVSRQSSRIILVGDSAQQIYDWRGAVDALAAFPDAPRAYLSQSFRFGEAVAEVANRVLGSLEKQTPLRLKGWPAIQSVVGPIDEPTAVLTRTNAQAVGTLLEAIVKGKKAFLVGGGADVSSFVRASQELQEGRRTSHPELACFSSWMEVQEYVKEDEGEDLKLLVKLINSFGAKTILSALESMPSEKDADLVVSTAHKCVAPETLVETSDWGIVPAVKLGSLTGGRIGTPTGAQRFAEFVEYDDAQMLKITTSDGYDLCVTENHGMMAWTGDKYERVDASQLREGQFLRLALFAGVPDPIDQPCLPNGDEIETDVRASRYNFPKELDDNSSFLLGALVADGTLWESGVRYTKAYRTAAEAVALAFSKIGVSPKVWQRGEPENDWVVEVNSTHLAEWLRRIGGLEPHNKDIPPCVFQGARSQQIAFLRGLFGDGNVGVRDGKLDVVSLTSCFFELAEKVQFMLRRLGVVSRRFPVESKSRDKIYRHWRVEMYSVWARKFLEDIGFPDTDRTQKGLAASVSETSNGYLVPVSREESGKALSKFTKQNARMRGYVSRRVIERDLPLLIERLAFHHDKIVSIEKYRGESVCVSVSGGRFLQNGFDGFNSKGREWNKVVLASDFPVNSWGGGKTYDEDGDEIEQPQQVSDSDKRLAYVAVTRAKLGLDITQCPFFTGRKKTSDFKGVAEHIKNNPPERNPRRGPRTPKEPPGQAPTTTKPAGQFTWAKWDNGWVVRGPSGFANQSVDVSKRDGSTSRKLLGEEIREIAEGISLYAN